jgi:2-oxoglutarate dehydrogenase E1 component
MSTVLSNPAAPAVTVGTDGHIWDAFRRWGYLSATLDPLGQWLPPEVHPELASFSGEAAERARQVYCGSIGLEFQHIPDPERRRWLSEQMEAPAAEQLQVDRPRLLESLIRADLFEQVLQARYLGTKRFSLEGVTALVPLLEAILAAAAGQQAEQAVIGMPHRGRLNIMHNIVGRDAAEIFANFEDTDPRSVLGSGDVKYHVGSTGNFYAPDGKQLRIHLASNPSHLEAVNPVVLGRTRAKQIRLAPYAACSPKAAGALPRAQKLVLPIVIHGDAAFAGQGIVAETLNFAHLEGFEVGGTINIVANNLVGFTANPTDTCSTRYSTDVAKRLPVPIFHVNGEDPEAVLRVGRIALAWRYRYSEDAVIDLVGYRRHGHSEVDDPSITQPILYRKLKTHPPLYEIYARQAGLDSAPLVAAVRERYEEAWATAKKVEKRPVLRELPSYWSGYVGGPHRPELDVETGMSPQHLRVIARALTRVPETFHLHPKIKKLLDDRLAMAAGQRPLDYGMAEALAFGSLVLGGTPVRMTGQDTPRGTFNQRHAMLVDTETEKRYVPLCNLSPDQARFEIYASQLSEAGVLGYEYGYSRDYPETLTLWEAQFGDFANGAQIIIDQFLVAGEDKWQLLSGLVLLLPHGMEGQGPEHSSARIERYLQLAANDNIQIAQPSTAAQYFHLLRRQGLSRWRKPLIVFTPKSMLRHPDALSPLDDLTRPRFLPVLADPEAPAAERVLLCSGKIGHELRVERKKRGDTKTAILFLEQFYPFPEAELAAALAPYENAHEIVWVQEEPANQGALGYVVPLLRQLIQPRPLLTVKRTATASPATGSAKAHELEQRTLHALAFGSEH